MGVVVEGFSKFLCCCLIIFQGLLLDGYLAILHHSKAWWLWTVADVAVLSIWIASLLYAKRKFHAKYSHEAEDGEAAHEIEYAYIFWFLYIAFLVPRIGILFHYKASVLEEEKILGPNFLKVAVTSTPLIFFLLVHGSHSNENRSSEHLSYSAKAFAGAIDLYDAVDLIEFLLEPPDGAPFGYMTASLTFCCISFFLPTLTLYALRKKSKPGRVSSLSFAMCYEFLNIFIINFPFLVIRSILWHDYHAPVSVLLMKNILCILVSGYEIIEHFGKFKPKRCEKCGDWFENSAFDQHQRDCNECQVQQRQFETPL